MDTEAISDIYAGIQVMGESSQRLSHDYLSLLAKFEDSEIQKRLLQDLIEKYVDLEKRVDGLLRNTLPDCVADEIKFNGCYPTRQFSGTILFSDCAGFTKLAEKMPPEKLIERLHVLFSGMDEIIRKAGGTKIKTIGDSYMAVFGAPLRLKKHADFAVESAISCIEFLEKFNQNQPLAIEMRFGIHSGTFMGGVVGRDRMQFDVFGDNVNIASRFESAGEKGRINISQAATRLLSGSYVLEDRGKIELKNKEPMNAFFVKRKD